ncbi:hypothetical protein, conserved, partial [Eimeria maxima]
MFELYVLLIFSRLCSIVPYEGYLPYDRSGDWLYQTLEALSLLLILPQLFMFQKQGKVEPFTSHFLAGQALSQ